MANKVENMFVLAQEYAYQRLNEGVTYTQVLTYLTDNHIPLESKLLDSFQWWFFNNFFHPDVTPKLHQNGNFSGIDLTRYYNDKVTLTGDAYLELLSHKEKQGFRKMHLANLRNQKNILRRMKIFIFILSSFFLLLIAIAIMYLLS